MGWPLSFLMAAQGLLLLYLCLIGVYTLIMSRLDRQYAGKDTLDRDMIVRAREGLHKYRSP